MSKGYVVDKKNKVINYNIQIIGKENLVELEKVLRKNRSIHTLDLRGVALGERLLQYVYEIEYITKKRRVQVLLDETINKRYQQLKNGGFFLKKKDPHKYLIEMFKMMEQMDNLAISEGEGYNWVICEDLREEDGLKYVIRILDYGAFLDPRETAAQEFLKSNGMKIGKVPKTAHKQEKGQQVENKGTQLVTMRQIEKVDKKLEGPKKELRVRFQKMKPHLTQPIKLYQYKKKKEKEWRKNNKEELALDCWQVGEWGYDELVNPYFGIYIPTTPKDRSIINLLRDIMDGKVEFK